MDDHAPRTPPRRAVVVGAGIVGLSVAWYLQARGVEVVVAERHDVGSGASWGNAGWLSPGLVAPLPEPAVLRYGLRALVDPTSAIYVPPTIDPRLWWFLVRLASRCTGARWRQGLSGFHGIAAQALDAYDELAASGVEAPTTDAPIVAGFTAPHAADHLRHELALLSDAGLPVSVSELGDSDRRALAPQLAERATVALRIEGQRYLDPGAFVTSLADAVAARGGRLVRGFEARAVRRTPRSITVVGTGDDGGLEADVVVLATGAWLDRLAAPFGVRPRVRAGRGYSFTVDTERAVPCPLYFPHARVACTPYRGALRIGGAMELGAVDAPADPRRLRAIEHDVRAYLVGVDWRSLRDAWVGPRPVTADGLPVIGQTTDPAVFVAAGHGMWGMTLGPVTGRLLAEGIVSGRFPLALRAFDPRR